ncbi:PorV/PorQ family protein [Salisaeta longa]|uniref:PorV/PorQ family protein n=1 Tax=Salisaeta longa TaxID=503170 RepID=UPI0003B6AF47|nr:PorV/PorQ family protein [Salisaeta longa]
MPTLLRRLGAFFCLLTVLSAPASAQRIAKYGADFLAGGVDARALGMGGAYVALAQEVSAGYWNVAGLSHLQYPQIAYMHVERFGGAVSFDYAAGAFPLSEQSTLGLSLMRSGVNDIVNTLNAWDPVRQQPRPNYESLVTTFSAADWALFVHYSRRVSAQLDVGVSFKGIKRSIGDFAEATGYSVDVAAQYRTGPYRLGVTVQDLSTMLQSWSVNAAAFQLDEINPATGNPFTYQEVFGQDIPQGGTALVLPVVRLGSGYVRAIGPHQLTVGLDMDVAFDGQQAFVPNVGDVSFHPRLGAAFSYQGVAEVRAGLRRLQVGNGIGWDVAPSVGAGLRLDQFSIDASFGDFTGLAAQDLGYTYRISATLTLEQPGMKRGQE